MNRLRMAAILAFSLLLGGNLAALDRRIVPLNHVDDLDLAGPELRRALNAWEEAGRMGDMPEWTRVEVGLERPVSLGAVTFLQLLPQRADDPRGARVQVVGGEGPKQTLLALGEEARVGGVRLLLTREPVGARPAELLVRSAEPRPLLSDSAERGDSAISITGLENPPRIVIEGDDPDALLFAGYFLDEVKTGTDPEEAARIARQQVPPHAISYAGTADEPRLDPREAAFDAAPIAAVVTLTLVQGESSALRQLSGSYAYDSEGRTPNDPRVRASGGGRGGTVSVGSAGDRFRARIRALEASGSVRSSSESFVRVQLGGEAHFSFQGPNGVMDGYVEVLPRGPGLVQLSIDHISGDWSAVGSVVTRVTVRDGSSVELARNTSTRTTSSSSGVPILSGVPYAGSLFRNERHTSQDFGYALVALVELE